MIFLVICLFLFGKVYVNYLYLDGLELVDELFDVEGLIDILIGCDYYWYFVMGEIRWGDEGFIVVNSKFGWLLFGLVKGIFDWSYVMYLNLIIEGYDDLFVWNEDDVFMNILKNFWEIEVIGIKDLI